MKIELKLVCCDAADTEMNRCWGITDSQMMRCKVRRILGIRKELGIDTDLTHIVYN